MSALPVTDEPIWLAELRGLAKRLGSIRAAADAIGYSRTAVSLVLAGTYGKSTEQIARAVMATVTRVACPVLGEIAADQCRAEQVRPYSSANPQRIALFRACHGGCVHACEAIR